MPATEENKAQVAENLRKHAAETKSKAVGTESLAMGLGDMLMEEVRNDRASRGVSKLATDRGNVMGQLVSDPNAIREFGTTEGTRMDPLDVDYYTSDRRAENMQRLGTIAQQGIENQGTLDEVIQAGANQLMARAQQMRAQAEQDEAEAKALMEKLYYEADRADRAFDEELALEQLNRSGSGDGGMGEILKAMLGQQQSSQEGGFTPVPDGFLPDEPEVPFTQKLAGAGEYIGNNFNPIQGMMDFSDKVVEGPAKALADFINKMRRKNKSGGTN